MTVEHRVLAAHVLRHLAREQKRGRAVRLDELAKAIEVRQKDVRAAVSKLHAEGYVNAQQMKLSLAGLAVATALEGEKLREIRRPAGAGRTYRLAMPLARVA